VTYTAYDDADDEPPLEPKSSRLFGIIIVPMLAMVGVISAFIWRAYGNDLAALQFFASGNGSSTAPSASAAEKYVGLNAFQSFQLQLAGQMQGTAHLLESQQMEIKRLSDQVAVLSEKINALQRPTAPAPVSKQIAPPERKKPASTAAGGNPNGASTHVAPPLQLNH
jgi:uncharacterized coiled-coil protein SlyX